MTYHRSSKFHISLAVSDVLRSQHFYTKLFDQEPSKAKSDYLKYEIENLGLVLSLQLSTKPINQFGHLGVRVESMDALQFHKKRMANLIEKEESETECCYAKQSKFWIADPDGYQWEIYHLLEDQMETQAVEHSACC